MVNTPKGIDASPEMQEQEPCYDCLQKIAEEELGPGWKVKKGTPVGEAADYEWGLTETYALISPNGEQYIITIEAAREQKEREEAFRNALGQFKNKKSGEESVAEDSGEVGKRISKVLNN